MPNDTIPVIGGTSAVARDTHPCYRVAMAQSTIGMTPSGTRAHDEAAERVAHSSVWAGAAVFVVAWLGVPWMVPVAAILPLAWHRFRGDTRALDGNAVWLRWLLSVLIGAICGLGLVGGPATRSVPMAPDTTASTLAWLGGHGDAIPSFFWMLGATGVFAAGIMVTRGFLAWVVLAVVAAQTSVSAHVVYTHATNLVTATPVALPPWTLAWLAGMALVLGTAAGGTAWPFRRSIRGWWLGPALLLLALVLRLSMAPAIAAYAAHVTG